MLFNSLTFIFLFLPFTLSLFYFFCWQNQKSYASTILIAASLFFYSCWDFTHTWLLLASIGANFRIGTQLARSKQPILLAAGITFNLAALLYYKCGFSHQTDTFSSLTSIAIPLAISFYTFQQIGFLTDCYKKLIPNTNFKDYLLFITFFPQLIAGPIIRYQEVVPQFHKDATYTFNPHHMIIGIAYFVFGLGKKVIFADTLASFSNPVFEAALEKDPITMVEAWCGTLAFTLQIYFDFSAYSDMAIGLGKMFNISLPINFNSPFKAKNRFEYWRNWHITMMRFIRSHVYNPLANSLRMNLTCCILITMVIVGAWHGTKITFIIWGFLNGCLLLINHLWHKASRSWNFNLNPSFCMLITFFSGSFLGVFFRAYDISSALNVIEGLFGFNGIVFPAAYQQLLPSFLPVTYGYTPLFLGKSEALWIVTMLIVVWTCPNTHELIQDLKGPSWWNVRLNKKWAVCLALVTVFSLFGTINVQKFVYYQF